MNILTAIRERHSTRAFLDRDVADNLIEQILAAARQAPSGANTQPWQVCIVKGDSKQTITDSIIAAREAGQKENPDYQYYPRHWREPYKSRRFATGMALYSALNIGRDDTERRTQAWYDNYRFFGAPVGLFFFIDKDLAQGSWLDLGMFIQNVMLAAIEFNLATVPQAALAEYPDIVRHTLQVPETQTLACGMSLGYADKTMAVNQYRVERVDVAGFSRWYK
ncbi:nitroreductase [Sulfuriflexus mobilis]|uniref:nitroreductase n=1 Tax=Sulfuriflexus mobilis TaxID=1811807 RepID=UPI000F81B78F|nr:nitroreductase [Sulfuriflexus mobilis]